MKSGFSLGGKFVEATVMFADIRSFTSITESHNPSEIIELLNGYFALMFEAIVRHGGTVNQMVGDGLMAVFGVPLPNENHCEEAVYAAIEMVHLLKGFNKQQFDLDKIQIRIGIGIASGRMIAGYTGTQYRATYTCIGDTVNLAARLEDHTKQAGKAILVVRNPRDQLNESFVVEALGPMLFKGKLQPIQIFSVK